MLVLGVPNTKTAKDGKVKHEGGRNGREYDGRCKQRRILDENLTVRGRLEHTKLGRQEAHHHHHQSAWHTCTHSGLGGRFHVPA